MAFVSLLTVLPSTSVVWESLFIPLPQRNVDIWSWISDWSTAIQVKVPLWKLYHIDTRRFVEFRGRGFQKGFSLDLLPVGLSRKDFYVCLCRDGRQELFFSHHLKLSQCFLAADESLDRERSYILQ